MGARTLIVYCLCEVLFTCSGFADDDDRGGIGSGLAHSIVERGYCA